MAETANQENGKQIGSQVGGQIGKIAASKVTVAAIGKTVGGAIGTVIGGIGGVAGSVVGGVFAANAYKAVQNTAKGLVYLPSALAAGFMSIVTGLISIAATSAIATFAWTIGSLVILSIFVAFVLVIINSSAYLVPPGTFPNFFNDDNVPTVNNTECPLLGGRLISSDWGSYNPDSEIGHGSNKYWASVVGSACSYSIPQIDSNCYAPLNPSNNCYDRTSPAQRCPYYGYAADFISQSTALYLPRVDGQNVVWNYVRTFANNNSGFSYVYTDTSGKYTIVLTHVADNALRDSNIQSGTRIGNLYIWSRTHLHVEFMVDGVFVRPEDWFCN